MDTNKFNNSVHDYWLPGWAWDAFENWPLIKQEYEDGKPYFDPLPNVGKKIPAIILGSGPSLDPALDLLSHWQGAIFCSPSQVNALLAKAKREPEFILALDSSDSQWDKLKGAISPHSTLLAHPSTPPVVLRNWKGNKTYFMTSAARDVWTGTILPAAFPWIENTVVNSGCSANTQMVIAHFMGYDPLFTVGVDFGFPGEMETAFQWRYRAPHVYLPEHPKKIDPDSLTPSGTPYIYHKGVLTTKTNVFYKTNALGNWWGYKQRWYDCSNGIITEVPKVPIQEVIENQVVGQGKLTIKGLPKYPRPKEIEERAWEYLEPLGCRPLIRDGRFEGVEFADKYHADAEMHKILAEQYKIAASMWTKDGDSWIFQGPPSDQEQK